MKNIKHIFFDLDHTLWDFDKNSAEALTEIFTELELHLEIDDLPFFLKKYREINAGYWHKYNHGQVTKQQVRTGRFNDILTFFNVKNSDEKAISLGNLYIERSPHKKHIFPNTHETLRYLQKKYKLHIITNGFEEVQHIKLKNCALSNYFDLVLCSEEVGVNKPNPLVFETALKKTGAFAVESVMIGDNLETDIKGSLACGFSAFHFDPERVHKPSQVNQINDLKELIDLL